MADNPKKRKQTANA